MGLWLGVNVRRLQNSYQMGDRKEKSSKEPRVYSKRNQSEKPISQMRTVCEQKWEGELGTLVRDFKVLLLLSQLACTVTVRYTVTFNINGT